MKRNPGSLKSLPQLFNSADLAFLHYEYQSTLVPQGGFIEVYSQGYYDF